MYDKIKVAIFDIDGTLTDGIYQISESGTITKSFHTRDFYAIEQLMRNDIQVIIITQSHDDVMETQLQRIYSHSDFWLDSMVKGKLSLWTAVDNKKHEIEQMFRYGSLGWDDIAYMGDAENDLDCIEMAGFSGCPTDAVPCVRDKAMYPSDYYGGKGAVHDFCMNILENIKKEKTDEDS